MSSPGPDYRSPAVEKALDVLELLAESPEPLTQSQVAEASGRSVGQLFRVLATLERRGFVVRERGGGYLLGTRLFDLAHRHEPLRGLRAAALPVMHDLADRVRQSCNLAVLDGDRVRVVAQVESPADFGYRVRVGALFDAEATATGEVLHGAAQAVRADAALQATKILMLTAKGRETDVAKGLALGANAYMTKPFSTRELVQKVADLLGRPSEGAA